MTIRGVTTSQAAGRGGVVNGENKLLEMVASGGDVSEILGAVCRAAEDVADGCRCGIYLIDWSGPRVQSFLAPNLPAAFNLSLSGLPVRPDTGPCARAACMKTPVIAADLDTDPLWRASAFRTLAAAHDLRSCWSTPIYGLAGNVLGALAVLQSQPASPTLSQGHLIARLAHVAGVAIERSQMETALDESGAKLARMTAVLALGASVAGELIHPLSGIVINAGTGLMMLMDTPPDIEGARATMRRTLGDCDRATEMISRLRDLLHPWEVRALQLWGSSSERPNGL